MTEPGAPAAAGAKFEFLTSRQFLAWMAERHLSIVFSTYQVGKVFFLGLQDDGRLDIFNRTFNRAMGIHVTPDTLWLSTLYQLWRFDNLLAPGENYQGYDRAYLPQMAWTTGDIDIHDIAVDAGNRTIFACTLFSCIATIGSKYSFSPLWRPDFVSRLAAEDRCHLNGFALRDGKPRYASCVSRSDVADGWRDRRTDGGIVTDIETGDIVLEGLSMPHSPRWYRDRLWVLDSGNGYLGYADLETGRFERVAFCPGYARGLAFAGDFALVGLSLPRQGGSFAGLELERELARRDAQARCGLIVIDLRTGDMVHWLRIGGDAITELYDIGVIEGVRRPMAVGLKTDEIRRVLSLPRD